MVTNGFFSLLLIFFAPHLYAGDVDDTQTRASLDCVSHDKNNCDEKNKESLKQILIKHCENYLIMLPKQMGCMLCQATHKMIYSQRYAHFLKRKKQLFTLISLLKDFDPKKTLTYLEKKMGPFKGEYGKKFYIQCTIILQTLVPN